MIALGHQVGLDTELHQRVGGVLTHGRYLQAGEGAGIEAVLLELLAHRAYGVDARETDPLEATGDQAVHRAVHLLRGARGLDRDRRDLDRDSAKTHESIEQVIGAVLGAGHEHTPAEERLDLEPRQAITLGHDLADNQDPRSGLLGRLGHDSDVVEGGDDRALLDGGATTRDDQRGLRRAAGRHERLRDRRGSVSAVEDDHRDAIAGKGSPVDVGIGGADDVHLAAATTCEAESGVGGNAGGDADTGSDLEAHLRLAQRGSLDRERAVEHGIAAEQSHGVQALTCGVDDELRASGVIERKTLGVDGRDEASLGVDELLGQVHRVDVSDDHVGGAQQGCGAQGDQLRIAGAGSDEGDRAELLLCACGAHGVGFLD